VYEAKLQVKMSTYKHFNLQCPSVHFLEFTNLSYNHKNVLLGKRQVILCPQNWTSLQYDLLTAVYYTLHFYIEI